MRTKKEINIQIGEQIRLAREEAKLTQEQLAERIDVSPQYISDLERGVVGISIATLKRACLVLSVSSDRILFGNSSSAMAGQYENQFKTLTSEQIYLLKQIVDSYLKAILLEHSRDTAG